MPQTVNYPWSPDDEHGGYVNPILFADYSDPDAIRVGDDFWLTASSFNCTPGLPILHSRDLVNWTIVGHALKNLPDPSYEKVLAGCGVWAPAIRFHDNRFWIFYPTPDEGIFMVTAANPRGPWTQPHMVQAGKGLIDPCPLWDDDGRAYLVFAYAGSRAGIKNRLDIREMAPDGTSLMGPPITILNDPKNQPTSEGPKFYKRGEWYYVFAPAGGVGTGWQLVLRSKKVLGPYEHRIVMAQGNTDVNGPHQGALVDAPNGTDWFVHFQEHLPYGRIVHLQPVTWSEGWPLIGEPAEEAGVGEPVKGARKPVQLTSAPIIPATSDDFQGPELSKQWQWQANHSDAWYSLLDRPGWLRLTALPVHADNAGLTPHLLLQKFPAAAFDVQTKVELPANGVACGMAVVGRESAIWLLHREADGCQLSLKIGKKEAFSTPVPNPTVELSVRVREGGECEFAYKTAGKWVAVQPKFKSREGMWIGAKIGLLAAAEGDGLHADFAYFQFIPPRG